MFNTYFGYLLDCVPNLKHIIELYGGENNVLLYIFFKHGVGLLAIFFCYLRDQKQ